MSDSLRPHGMQHTRVPYPSPTLGTCSNSCPSSWCCHPTISSSATPVFNLSEHQGLIKWDDSLHQVAKVLELLPWNQYVQWIFRVDFLKVDWFQLLAVQGILKSLFQYHSSKHSILCHSAFFMVQLSHLYMTTGKAIALTRWTFVGKVMSLLFNMLSRFS